MKKIMNFIKGLSSWPKIVATLGILALLAVWMWSCSAQKTLHVSGTVQNAEFDYNSNGSLNVTK